MNAQQVVTPSFLSHQVALPASAQLDLDIASGERHTRPQPPEPRDAMVRTLGRRIAVSDVCDLIDAAGPLSLRDIAGGLDISLQQASCVVGWMLEHDCLRQDEWERHGLWGACGA